MQGLLTGDLWSPRWSASALQTFRSLCSLRMRVPHSVASWGRELQEPPLVVNLACTEVAGPGRLPSQPGRREALS